MQKCNKISFSILWTHLDNVKTFFTHDKILKLLSKLHIFLSKLLTNWFARKKLRWHSCFYNVYYYWHNSGSFNYWQDNSPPIWRCIFIARQADRFTISASARALKVCMYYPDPMISFENIHVLNKRATPTAMMNYNLGIQLYKLYNTREHSLEWLHLNQNQILTSRQVYFEIFKSNSLRVGLNALANRLSNINGKIKLLWLNLLYDSFKIKCKNLFINN